MASSSLRRLEIDHGLVGRHAFFKDIEGEIHLVIRPPGGPGCWATACAGTLARWAPSSAAGGGITTTSTCPSSTFSWESFAKRRAPPDLSRLPLLGHYLLTSPATCCLHGRIGALLRTCVVLLANAAGALLHRPGRAAILDHCCSTYLASRMRDEKKRRAPGYVGFSRPRPSVA